MQFVGLFQNGSKKITALASAERNEYTWLRTCQHMDSSNYLRMKKLLSIFWLMNYYINGDDGR